MFVSMKKRDAAMLFSGVTLLIAITLLIIYKKGFWWYVGAFLLLSPIAGRIGWAIGKEDTKPAEEFVTG